MQTVSVDEKKNTVVLKAEHRSEDGMKRIEKFELKTRNPDKIKHIERKLMDQGVQRMERHPMDGIPLKRPPPKSGYSTRNPSPAHELCHMDAQPYNKIAGI
ncbi:PREDICTED: uncharacterized protein LOC104823222 [Tarenaya hassleriana]|uniref:uncharacterized protein LOC104823222 n=1 Tax=Tarenaya hassleriana TaxID=28532 RepID=UPI00053C0DFF|nr:PREDICTED: uncharacterized protein LOC104823222 [Tarenaya hassleriana]